MALFRLKGLALEDAHLLPAIYPFAGPPEEDSATYLLVGDPDRVKDARAPLYWIKDGGAIEVFELASEKKTV